MIKRTTSLALLLTLGILMAWTSPSSAYRLFSGDNNCDQCHTQFEGSGEATHDFHTAFVGCFDCHGSIGDNPLISACAECHNSNWLKNHHITAAFPDGEGKVCSTCHSIVPNESWTWGDTKTTFR